MTKWCTSTTALLLLVVVALCSTQDLNSIEESLKDKFGSDLSAVNETLDAAEEKCKKVGGPDAFAQVKDALVNLTECFKDNFNHTVIMDEIEKAKPSGDLDTVFGKYCRKKPVVMGCLDAFLLKLDQCLEPQEREQKEVGLNVTNSLVDFVCYKDGDRIAMFIAEGGVECLQSQQEEVQRCANETLRLPAGANGLTAFLEAGGERCADFERLSKCVVGKLEACAEPTPANIVEALFKFIRKVTPCSQQTKQASLASSSSSTSSFTSAAGLLLATLAFLL